MGAKWMLVSFLAVTGSQRGCFGYEEHPPAEADADADADCDVDADSDVDTDGDADFVPLPGAVDLLVVVDDSNSMAQEQAALSEAFTTLMHGLVQPPDLDGDGVPDYPAVTDLHVGVVSTDMGTGGFAVQTCADSDDGDDGVLNDDPSDAVPGCADDYPRFLEYAEGSDAEALAADFGCIATLGTGGCGFEQQLAATRRALTAHQQGTNEGFLREGSVLAVLLVTDEDDCSVRTDIANATDIFNTQLALGPLNLRCYHHRGQYVEPIETFVSDILALRPGHPERVIVGGVLGTPPDSDCDTGDMGVDDFDCLLAEPAMQEAIDHSAEGRGERLVPSCEAPGMGQAFPPRRLVEFIRGVQAGGGSGNVQSICQSDWSTALSRIAGEIRAHLAE